MDDTSLRAAARRSYEKGRLAAALRSTWFLPPLLAFSLWGCGQPIATCAAGAGALVLAVFLEWRGEAYSRARRAGLLAGLVPFALPLFARACGHPCGPGECTAFLGLAAMGGLVAGVGVGLSATSRSAAALGLLLAALVGSLGCALAGVMGLAAMAGALLVTSIPVYLLAHARRPA